MLYQLQVNFSKQYTVAISFINQINHGCEPHLYTDDVLLTWAESFIWYFMYMIGQGLHTFLSARLFLLYVGPIHSNKNYILGQWISWISIILPKFYFYVYVYTRPKQ